MNTKSVTVMGMLAVVLAGAALVVSQMRPPASPHEGRRLFPDLLAAVNDVSEVRVTSNSGAVTLLRDNGVWRVEEKHRYPADMGKVRATIIGLAELTMLEAKTSKPERYEQLGVQDVDAEGSVSTGVALKDSAGEALADVIVGNERRAGRGQEVFIRQPGNPQAWLAGGAVVARSMPEEWLDKEFLHIDMPRVRRVAVTHPDGTKLVLEKEKPDDPDFRLADLPKGREVESQASVTNIVSAVTTLSFDDIHPASDFALKKGPAATAAFETFDGLEGTVRVFQREEKYYATVSAAFNAGLVLPSAPEDAADDGADGARTAETAEDAADEPPEVKPAEDVKAEAEALAQTVADWVYAIPLFRAETILTKPKTLLRPLDDKQTE